MNGKAGLPAGIRDGSRIPRRLSWAWSLNVEESDTARREERKERKKEKKWMQSARYKFSSLAADAMDVV